MQNKPEPSAVEWLSRLDAGEISSVELVERTIERLQGVNPVLNAVIAQDSELSLAQARQADKQRSEGKKLALLGLPITVKDSIDVEGFVCTGGSFARENFRPEKDATAIARLRAAGAIVVAKTNLPEYSSSYETDNAIFGRTNHPADLERTPGGSSGGEGALLAADASIVGIGLDGGGSIRVPSHYCGTVGIRPTVGRIPDTGSWPQTRDTGYRDLMCIGPMGRYIEDLALLLPIMSGPDWIDPYANPAPLGRPEQVDVRSLKVAYYLEDDIAKISAETEQAVLNAVQALEKSGAAVSKVTPADFKDATKLFFSMAGADGGSRTWRDLEGSRGRHHSQFQDLLDGFGKSQDLDTFFDTQGRFFAFRSRVRQFISNYDVIICPVTTGPAPKHMQAPHGIAQEDYLHYAAFNFLHTYAVAGVPSTVVPAGEQDGMPLGVQVLAQAYEEHVSLAAAAVIEKQLGGYQPRTAGLHRNLP